MVLPLIDKDIEEIIVRIISRKMMKISLKNNRWTIYGTCQENSKFRIPFLNFTYLQGRS